MSTLSPPVLHKLDRACAPLVEVFGSCVYLVGSQQMRTAGPLSDVDVRMILSDKAYARLMKRQPDGFATLLDFAIGAYLREATGLPIDFQVQQRSAANERHAGAHRNPLGGRALTAWFGDARPDE